MVNKRPKIKLIFPCRIESYKPYQDYTNISGLPYGMGMLTSYLREQSIYVEQDDLAVRFNHQTTLLDTIRHSKLHINKFAEDIGTFLKTDKLSHRLEKLLCKILYSTSIKGFDIIGFSIFTDKHFLFALLLSNKIKDFTNTPIVFGGPFITLYGQLYPEAFKFIDFMISGDGRIPFSQLARCLVQKTPLEHIPGIIYKHKGSLTIVPRVQYSIEEMPIPDFEGLPLDLYRARNFLRLPYQISRGCNGACSFCVTKNIDASCEYKSYHKVVAELQQLKEKYDSNLFYFCDNGAINNSYGYLEGLCRTFIDNKINIRWGAYARIEHLDREILEKMKLAGCQFLSFGVESGSDRILRLMNKGITTTQTEKVLRDSARVGIKNSIFLILGYPQEHKEDVESTVDFIRRNKKYLYGVQCTPLYVSYGSNLWRHPETYGITIKSSISNGTPMASQPSVPERVRSPLCCLSSAGLNNIVPLVFARYVFAFDEIGGLRWQEKRVQQERSRQQVVRAIRKYVIIRFHIFMLFQKLIYFVKSVFDVRVVQRRGDK